MTIAKAPRRKVESEGGSILTSEYAGVNNETTSQYEKVDVQRALLSCPEGFYSHYDMIPSEHRKLVLLRLPKNLRVSRKRNTVADLSLGDDSKLAYKLARGGAAEIPLVLAVPGESGLRIVIKRISSSLHDREGSIFRFSPTRTRNFNQTIESAFDDMWTLFKVPSLPSVKSVSQGSADVLETEMRIHMGAGGHGKPQPPDLNMRLSPVDLSSIPAAKRSRVVVPNQ